MTRGIKLHVWGDLACFTRPEMKVERVSYDVITPSAARGIVEAIYWKPEIRWQITKLHVLRPVRFTSLRRNEVANKIAAGGAGKAMKAGRGRLGLYVEEDRQQRSATVLRDVAYVIEARFDIVEGEVNAGKHLDQFRRRAERGQCYTRPFLGNREFPCDFAWVTDPPAGELSDAGEQDLGWMLNDLAYIPDPQGKVVDGHRGQRFRAEPQFFRAIMRDGIIEVPSLDDPEVRA